MSRPWLATKQTISDFMKDDCLSLAGALAFYTALSLAPLLVILYLDRQVFHRALSGALQRR
jgi:uncharacterized BrkB/YihY/UPF0761 family membrane protein